LFADGPDTVSVTADVGKSAMQNRKRRPLWWGERVQISDCDAGASGVVVALLEVDFQAQAYEE